MISELEKLCRKHHVRAKSVWAEPPDDVLSPWKNDLGASHWKVTLFGWGRQITTEFHMGSAHTEDPKAADVLACLCMDAFSVDNACSFEEWASEFGYDSDSRKAERIYQACDKMRGKLKRFLGEHYQTFCQAEH